MTIMELGALGEFVSGIVIIVTLVYLTLQIRQVKREMQVNASFSVNKLFNDTANAAVVCH